MIENVTGVRPPTCPWRAFTTPIVREVMDVEWASPKGNLSVAVGPDAPEKLVKAVGIFERALEATMADERRIEKVERERDRRTKEAMRKARG